MRTGKLYGLGIGPGDPGLLTLKAAEILRRVDVIFTVISRNATASVSEFAVASQKPRGEIRRLTFSMSLDSEARAAQVRANAQAIMDELAQGRDCAFATLGDAMTYSTFGYLLEIIKKKLPEAEIEIVPGVTSFAMLAARSGRVLVENGEELRVIPSFKKEMAETLEFPSGSTTILLKTYRSRDALIARLRGEEGLEFVYGERLGLDGEFVSDNSGEIAARPEAYLSLMMVKKR